MAKHPLNCKDLLNMETFDLLEHLYQKYVFDLPEVLLSVDDLQKAISLSSILASNYSYLATVGEYAKIIVRESKGKITKEQLNELIGKRDIIVQSAENCKMQYNALSRMITIKQEINRELGMSGSKCI